MRGSCMIHSTWQGSDRASPARVAAKLHVGRSWVKPETLQTAAARSSRVKRLILMRHAEAKMAQTDHARALSPRGVRDAPIVATRLATSDWVPDAVISSDAVRTRETYALMADAFDPSPEVDFVSALYHAGVGDLLAEFMRVSDRHHTLLVIGHNPGLEDVVSFLSGVVIKMTEADAALLVHPGAHWQDACPAPGSWSLEALVEPPRKH